MKTRFMGLALLTSQQTEAILTLRQLSSPFHMIDEQPFISRKEWCERHGLNPIVIRSLKKRNFIEYGAKSSVRLTSKAYDILRRAKFGV